MAQNKLPSFFTDDFAASPMFQDLQREMNQLLQRFRHQPGTSTADWMNPASGRMMSALDVSESDEAFEITAEIPGVSEDDIEVSIIGDVLTLRGEKTIEREEKDKDFHLVERAQGSFRRQVSLGFVPEEGAVDAEFSDGVLTLTIAKPTEAKPRAQTIAIRKS